MAQLVMKRPQGSTTLTQKQDISERDSGPDERASGQIIRAAVSEDAAALAKLLGTAFPEMEWHVDRANRELLDAPDVTETFVAEQDGNLLATASARHFDERFPRVGYVHWVAVDPAARGGGLFDEVMGRVLDWFAADGRPEAILETDDMRLPAIAAYLRLGFVPQYTEADHELRWSKVFTALAEARRKKGKP